MIHDNPPIKRSIQWNLFANGAVGGKKLCRNGGDFTRLLSDSPPPPSASPPRTLCDLDKLSQSAHGARPSPGPLLLTVPLRKFYRYVVYRPLVKFLSMWPLFWSISEC